MKNRPLTDRIVWAVSSDSAMRSNVAPGSPICSGWPTMASGTGTPSLVSTVVVRSGRIEMSSRRVEAAPSSRPWAPGSRSAATRRCGTEPWSDMPASTTVVLSGRMASSAPALASASRSAALRSWADSLSGTVGSLPSAVKYGLIRSSTSMATTRQRSSSCSRIWMGEA
ncbi:hypothetical protein [Nonomuraea recticatena]|uniref:hypothetical protein n=1 Tax=Nonomuraea recticatena TaxID=46178 RepID=UPI0036094697